MRCDDCQALLLDHLYGLLDGPEAVALDAHLAGCAGCTAAREQAARVRGLFARAAKSSFPDVRFVPPAQPAESAAPVSGPPLAEPAPAPTAPFGRRPARREPVGWAAVAVVLVLTPAVVLPVRSITGRYDAARRGADEATSRFAEARAERDRIADAVRTVVRPVGERYAAAAKRHHEVLSNWVARELVADKADRDRKLTVKVERPAAVQPGAPNELVVSVDGRGAVLPPGHVEAEVLDEAGHVLARQPIEPGPRPQTVRIPAEVWAHLKPQSELFLAVAAVDDRAGRTELIDRVRLFGPVYATMLVTDKATYRPGETVHFRSLTLDRVSLRPPDREQVLRFELRKVDATNPAGELVGKLEEVGAASPVRVVGGAAQPVLGPDGQPVRGVGCGSFALPTDLADGDYTLVLTEHGSPATIPVPVTRTVRVRAGLPEKFRKEIHFDGASFGPGNTVQGRCELKLGDKPVADAKVTVVAEVDGVGQPVLDENLKPVRPGVALKTDPDGKARFAFVLPRQLLLGPAARGDVRVKATFEPADGSRPESVAKRVPVVGKDIVVEFFPEGGDLIAGAECRVYVRATTPTGQPVDITGTVVDGRGEPVGGVETSRDGGQAGANRGLGSFTFTPKANTTYTMKLEQPATAARSIFNLPGVKAEGVAMRVLDPVTGPGEAVRVELRSVGVPRKLVVGAYVRGRLADTRQVEAKPGEPVKVELMGDENDRRGGVTRITVFEVVAGRAEVFPIAERLVFRRPGERLNLAFSANAGRPVTAGSAVDLTVSATDEHGKPVPAIVWVAAVNAAVAPGPKDRSLPTHFLLAGEVQTPDDLEHADFLLTDDRKAAENLDRVLATQGWRRFAEQKTPPVDLTQKRELPYQPAERLQLLLGQYRGGLEPPRDREHQRLTGEYWPGYERAATELDAARQAKERAEADRSWEPGFRRAKDATEARRQDAVRQVEAAQAAAGPLGALRTWGWLGVVGLVLLGGGSMLGAVRSRGDSRSRVLFGLAAVGALGLAGFLAASESAVAARAAEPIPPSPGVEIVGDPSRIKEGNERLPLPEPTRQPGNGGPTPIGSGNQTTDPPAVPPTNTAGRPTPAIRVPEGPRPILDGRRLVADDDLRPRPAPVGRARPHSDDPDRRAAERLAALKFAEARERTIVGTLNPAFGLDPLGNPVQPVKPGTDRKPPAELIEVFKRVRSAVPATPPLVVREYAAPRPGSGADPADEPDTVLWMPLLVLPADGQATVSFHVGSAAGYQVIVAGHTLDGRIGAVGAVLPVAKPAPGAPE